MSSVKNKIAWEQAINLNPVLTLAYNQLGLILMSQSQYIDAIEVFRRGLSVDPVVAEMHRNLGNALKAEGRLSEAASSYKTALCLDTSDHIALGNLGATYKHLGDYVQAEKCLTKAIALDSSIKIFHYNLGIVYEEKWQFSQALACFDKAIQLDPNFKEPVRNKYLVSRQLCDFKLSRECGPELDRLSADDPFISIVRNESFEKNLQSSRNWSRELASVIPKNLFEHNQSPKLKTAKIHIGYISNDFREHPIGRMTAPLFRLHNRKRFEVTAYSYGADDQSLPRQLAIDGADRFVDLRSLGILESATRIYEDKVDILVDLTGYTENHRLEILAMRPAPIQISWLGFPGTSGADFFDYLITDRTIVPTTAEKFFSEKLIFLPCYQMNDDRPLETEIKYNRADFGLPKKAIVFASFNQTYKIDEQMWQVWMRILHRVPNSVMCLWQQCPDASINLKQEAEKAGISTDRLIFMDSMQKVAHLARLAVCDIGLDTRVYGGHTTTTDCLRVGVPVITKIGNHFASRVCASLLKSVNLDQLIVESLQDYEDLAVDLALNPTKLKAIKKNLTPNRLKRILFNPKKMVKRLEQAYENCLC